VSAARIVSLVPSSTETLLALGAEVIACTRFCEQPGIATVGGTKNPDIDAIVRLEPDLVVLDREENRIADHDALVGAGLALFVSDVRSVDDARHVVADLRELLGMPTAPLPELPLFEPAMRRTAFVPIWRRPWMSISEATYGGSLLGHLGIDLVTRGGAAYPTVELDDIARPAPDLVLVPSEPYDFSAAHTDELRRAFPTSRVIDIDGQDLFWWGARTPAAIARLAAVVGGPRQPSG